MERTSLWNSYRQLLVNELLQTPAYLMPSLNWMVEVELPSNLKFEEIVLSNFSPNEKMMY
jgi:hypothetical protein